MLTALLLASPLSAQVVSVKISVPVFTGAPGIVSVQAPALNLGLSMPVPAAGLTPSLALVPALPIPAVLPVSAVLPAPVADQGVKAIAPLQVAVRTFGDGLPAIPSALTGLFDSAAAVGESAGPVASEAIKQPRTLSLDSLDASLVRHDKKMLVKHYQAALDRVSSGLLKESHLKIPNAPIEITMHPFFNHPGDIASLDIGTDKILITVPFQWIAEARISKNPLKYRFFSKHPKHSLPLFYHEIGHAIFRENVAGTDSLLGDYFLFLRREREEALLWRELSDRYNSAASDLERTEIGGLRAESRARFVALIQYRKSLELQPYPNVLDGLDELFADLTAVLAAEDPGAMADVQNIMIPRRRQAMRRLKDSIQPRDFTDTANDLGRWKVTADVHAYFAPVRSFLYREYLRYPRYLSGDQKAKLYDNVLAAIVAAAPRSLKAQERISPADMNRQLIAAIRSKMTE